MIEPANQHSEDYELVQAALKGKEAFARLVAKYQQRVYHTAYQVLRNAADAQDITQETFIRAYESLKKYDPRYRFLTYLTRIAVNLSRNALKKRKKLPVSLGSVSDYPAKFSGTACQPRFLRIPREKIFSTLDTLRPKHRIAFILFHIEKRPYRQIASIMQVPVSSVKNYLFRARRKLRKKLSAELEAATAGGN
jgi:RNA polymerase sigma-70 factor (ECF subfamily)